MGCLQTRKFFEDRDCLATIPTLLRMLAGFLAHTDVRKGCSGWNEPPKRPFHHNCVWEQGFGNVALLTFEEGWFGCRRRPRVVYGTYLAALFYLPDADSIFILFFHSWQPIIAPDLSSVLWKWLPTLRKHGRKILQCSVKSCDNWGAYANKL